MDIKGRINFFVRKRGSVTFYEGSITKKTKEGNYENCSIEVKFPKESPIILDKLNEKECYQMEVHKGFLSVDSWEDKTLGKTRRKLILVVTDGEILKVFPIKKDLSKESKTNLNK